MRLWATGTSALLLALGLLIGFPATASAGCDYGSGAGNDGIDIGVGCGNQDQGGGGGGPGTPATGGGYTGPLYEHYYTPACSVNGPPGAGNPDALCMGAVSICDNRPGGKDDIFMQHWRRQVFPEEGRWEHMGNECRGADEATEKEPEVTADMVVDSVRALAPQPTAAVQPGNRSFVNIPNNYYAEDAADQTVNVQLLGKSIAVEFGVDSVTWDFGDGSTATGAGVKDATLGQQGAVEHAYEAQGDYEITATTHLSVHFTLPNGQTVDMPNVFAIDSEPVTLPVAEIQTRVDATR
jgi:hypothetical protein